MNWKLFLSTFALIFLAELGDKTQLAAMLRASTPGASKWTVFAAAALALVFSALIAVLFGSVLSRFLHPMVIKIGAGTLFVIIGLLILRSAFVPARAGATETGTGPMARTVMRLAAQFEESSFEDYRKLAAASEDASLRALFETLAREEMEHLAQMRQAAQEHQDVVLAEDTAQALPAEHGLDHDVADHDLPIIDHALKHERATARFYAELARITPSRSLRNTFTALAAAEEQHARRLADFAAGAGDRI